LLTTLLRIYTTARRHCEAARRQQARVTAGGPSFDASHARRGRKVWAKPATTPLACASSAQSPGTGRCQKEAALAVFIPLPKLAVCHTQYNSCEKCEKCVSQRIEPTASCTKSVRSTSWTKTILGTTEFSGNQFKGYKTRLTYPGTQGTVSTQSTPIRGSKSPRPAGALASLGGSSATRP
jgi:hypothetical protein